MFHLALALIIIPLFLVSSFNHGYEKGHLSVTQRQGVITGLPKEGKSTFYIKNWRPISLLNVDQVFPHPHIYQ
jgi:hypothetical protein